jgi:hypothetical protein
MNRSFVRYALVAAFMAVVFSSIAALGQEFKGPRLLVKEMVHDAGSIRQGTNVEHEFEISNGGQEMLVIDRVQSS